MSRLLARVIDPVKFSVVQFSVVRRTMAVAAHAWRLSPFAAYESMRLL